MTDKPILFSSPMVRALLDGSKTQTRRLITNAEAKQVLLDHSDVPNALTAFPKLLPVRVSSGDCLWVREHWKAHPSYDDIAPCEMGGEESLKYLADSFVETWGWGIPSEWGRHRQAMHMPRWASRLTLTVTDVRVQRLQDISEDDARAEGVKRSKAYWHDYSDMDSRGFISCRRSFQSLWDSLNSHRAPWHSNPWVVAYTFSIKHGNIDLVTP